MLTPIHKISNWNFLVKVLFIAFIFCFNTSWGQVNLVGFNLDNTLSPSINNVVGIPSFTSSGVAGLAFNSTAKCQGTHSYEGNGWAAGNYHRITFDGTGFRTFVMKFQDRTSGTGINGFNVRVTIGATTTVVVPTYTPATSCTTRTSTAFPCAADNNSNIIVEFYKTDATSTNSFFRLDTILITGFAFSAPSISPATQTICTSTQAVITVTSSIATPTLVWQGSANGTSGWANVANGTPAGATYTSSALTLSLAAASTYYYKSVVDEGFPCTYTTTVSSVIVNTPPAITSQPSNTTICAGSNTSFVVAASGSPLTYQWQEKVGAAAFANITNGGVYGGATTATLNLTAPPTSMSTNSYQCIVSVASCSSATTSAAVLTINTAPSITSQPSNTTICSGSNTSFIVAASGSSVTYQWQEKVGAAAFANITNGGVYGGATTATLNLTAPPTSMTTNSYQCIVSVASCSSATTTAAVLTINAPVLITAGATNKGVCSAANTSMDVTAATAPKQWWVSTDGGTTFSAITATTSVYTAGITTNALTITAPPASYNNYQYQLVVSVPGCPVITSTVGILTVTQTPSAPPTPTALANPACSNTSLSAMSSTVAGVTWYWQGTTALGTSTANATSSAYAISSTNTYYVRARTDGSSCLSTDASALVSISTTPTITGSPTDVNTCAGSNASFTVTSSGQPLTYQWQENTGGGFVNIINGGVYNGVLTATLNLTGVTTGMNGYQYRCIVSASPCASATSNLATLITVAIAAPTTAASAPVNSSVGCNAFKISWTNGNGTNRLVVVSAAAITATPSNGTSYTANSIFGSGTAINVGNYVVYKGTSNSVFVTGLSASTTYYYQIFEYNNGCTINYLSSGTIPGGNQATTSCSFPAGITGVYIDACSGGCGWEGNNEMIWATTGSYGMAVNNNGPTLHYNAIPTPTLIQISTYAQNASNITALNTAVGACGSTIFVDPNAQGYIPPFSKYLIANNCMCTPSVYDFSALCGSGPIYVVFGTNSDWPCNSTGGIFSNYVSGGTVRYFDLDMNSWGVNLAPIYNYTIGSLVGNDGAIILTNPSGGAAYTYSNSACKVPTVILPIELLDFYATKNSKVNDIVWTVAQEEHILYYTVEKSNDAVNFTQLATVYSNNERQLKSYSAVDDEPFSDITYYRLSTKETNGLTKNYRIISVDEKNTKWHYNHYQTETHLVIEFKNSLPKNSTINLYDLSGKALLTSNINQSQTSINTQAIVSGIYFIQLITPYKTENFKIIISK